MDSASSPRVPAGIYKFGFPHMYMLFHDMGKHLASMHCHEAGEGMHQWFDGLQEHWCRGLQHDHYIAAAQHTIQRIFLCHR